MKTELKKYSIKDVCEGFVYNELVSVDEDVVTVFFHLYSFYRHIFFQCTTKKNFPQYAEKKKIFFLALLEKRGYIC